MELNLQQLRLLREAWQFGCFDLINLEALNIPSEACDGLVKKGLLSERRLRTASPTWRLTYLGENALGAKH